MAYQSKTYSLSDEVVAVFERFKTEGVTPNQLLMRIFGIGKINPNGGIDDDSDIEEMRQRHRAASATVERFAGPSGPRELTYEREE